MALPGQIHPHAAPGLLPRPGLNSVEVPMTLFTAPVMRDTPATYVNNTVWTRSISDCCVVAIYHPGRNVRSLFHIQGGGDTSSPGYQGLFFALAGRHDQHSTFVIVGGGNWGDIGIELYIDRFRRNLAAAMAKRNVPVTAAQLQITGYSTQPFLKHPDISATFAFRPDGSYGFFDRDPDAIAVNDPAPPPGAQPFVIN